MGADYIFACARVRGAEKNLLGKDKLGIMVEAKTMEDALKVLSEAQYGNEGEVVQPADYERLLGQETAKLYDFMKEIAPGEGAFRIFSYPFDYHNIKTLLKAEALGTDGKSILMSGGTIDPAAMAILVKERNFMPMTGHMKTAVEESVDTLARTRDPQSIDLICDRECYADILEAAKASGNPFVLGYVQLLIDTINLKTFVRVRKMGQPWSFFGTVFLPGGTISEKTFVAGYEEPIHQFAARLKGTALYGAAQEGLESMKETGSFTSIERLCDDAVMKYVKDAKYISFGIEPLIAYTAAKQAEIKSVRIVLAGKAAGLAPNLIRERLRETYG